MSLAFRSGRAATPLAVAVMLHLVASATGAQEPTTRTANGEVISLPSAIAEFEAGRYAEAAASFRSLHEATPGNATTMMYLGRLALLRGDDDTAAEWLERAVRADGDVAEHHHWLGRARAQEAIHAGLFRRVRLAGAIKSAFERAVQLDPRDIEARLDLLRFYVAAPGIVGGSVRAAKEQADAVARLDAMWGHIARGIVAEKEDDLARAEREYRAALVSHQDRAAPYYALGAMYQRAGRFGDAYGIYERLRAARPDETAVLYQIGRTASVSGERLEAGARALERYLGMPTVEGTPLPASAQYRLGLILERQGRFADARRALEQAARLEPERDDVREALKRLP